MKKIYNKLVRDKIPEIIQKSGDTCSFTILEDRDYANALMDKLAEELNEFTQAFDSEDDEKAVLELVDLVEVCYSVLELIGVTKADFEKIRENKAIERGRFSKKVFLHEVDSN